MSDFLDKRIQRSKAALKQTCLDLLAEKPFEEITISEIVRKANYNRGTFYAHFHTKEELIDEIIDDTLGEMIRQIRHPYQTIHKVNMKDLNTEEITLFSYFQEQAPLYKLLLSSHIRADFRYRMAKAIEQLFIAEYDYEFSSATELDPKWLYIFRAHGIAGLVIRWIEEDFPESPEYMAKQIVELMLTSTEVFYVKNKHVPKKP
ncbi:AcrR family transcriptional regulator [Paenibacillus rhizosphaerae]|uniref:AcrR family transcriptional regulator n=1 Tax=Paenibacillus rhizosphaerae TaxID=297318 RepID=A0A839TFU2_9BACL|nr:TetR/AcrR family transcriptional regulator [Paenibacillus rhizosphaerae]MBB3125665.1 AcrR family transcriptional regulator [Paenibacillus rhizosphaerae]